MKNNSTKNHRGRIQAQGNGLEKSESWEQDEPLSYQNGKELIENLKNQLTPSELEEREKAFSKLEKLIDDNCEDGLSAQLIRSFKSHRGTAVRVDLEIRSGLAFKK